MISRRTLLVGLGSLTATEAFAHKWYSEKKNPTTGIGCCGKEDCFEVEHGRVIREGAGYRWLDAPNYDTGWIADNEVLQSPNGDWHVCWRLGRVYCLFIPFST